MKKNQNFINDRREVFCFLFFFWPCCMLYVGSEYSDHGLNPSPLQWKRGVLITGPPGKSQEEQVFNTGKVILH